MEKLKEFSENMSKDDKVGFFNYLMGSAAFMEKNDIKDDFLEWYKSCFESYLESRDMELKNNG